MCFDYYIKIIITLHTKNKNKHLYKSDISKHISFLIFYYDAYNIKIIMSIDSLVNTSMKNNLISDTDINFWRNSILLAGKSTSTNEQVKTILDQTLQNTTIKRACCLAGGTTSYPVKVRIPIPSDFSGTLPKINTDFGFIDKVVQVPPTMCNSLPSSNGNVPYKKPNRNDPVYSKPCDDFYKLYCANMLGLYTTEYLENLGGQSPDPFIYANEYKPECACYNFGSDIPSTVPLSTKCLMYPNCNESNYDTGVAYLDPKSRDLCPQSITICQQVVDLTNAQAGGNITISSQLKNQCGSTPGWNNVVNSTTIPPTTIASSPTTSPTTSPISSPTTSTTTTIAPTTSSSSSSSSSSSIAQLSKTRIGLIAGIAVISSLIIILLIIIFVYRNKTGKK